MVCLSPGETSPAVLEPFAQVLDMVLDRQLHGLPPIVGASEIMRGYEAVYKRVAFHLRDAGVASPSPADPVSRASR